MNLKIILAGEGALMLSVMCLAIGILSTDVPKVRSQQSSPQFKPHSLVSALPTEIGQAAIDHTLAQFRIMSGSAQVLLTRSIAQILRLEKRKYASSYKDLFKQVVISDR